MKKKKFPCITLVGMPGAGKTTVGAILARRLGWSLLDTDKVIEALYGKRLQDVTDHFGRDEFLDIEECVITGMEASRCVIAPGGSVVYRKNAMDKLASLGPVVYLNVPREDIRARIEENPERGIAISPGQSLFDLYQERSGLYEKYASIIVDTRGLDAEEVAGKVLNQLDVSKLNEGSAD